jgi:DNA-binding transcriptional LysR family regulator
MDVHLRMLRYFVAVADELNVTRAAERLFVSQPALSKQLRQLEALVQTRLVHREQRGVRLTAAGEALLPHARHVIAVWEAALPAVNAAAAAAERTLVIGFHTRMGRNLVANVTAGMAVELPGWRLQFRQVPWSDPTVGLADGGVDIAIGWLPVPEDAGLAAKVVATEPRCAALPTGHRLAREPLLHFADLDEEPFVALPVSAGAMRDFWLASDRRGAPARVAAEANTVDEALEAVAVGTGIALVAAGNGEIYRREDVVVRPVVDLAPAELATLWRSNDRRPAVRAVVDACCTCGAAAPPGLQASGVTELGTVGTEPAVHRGLVP